MTAHAADVILNEYNAVANDQLLTCCAEDVFWGRRPGNGRDWFELVVIADHLDMRAWELIVSDNTGEPNAESWSITLTDHEAWSDLRSGTIITISEQLRNNVDDYNPVVGRWWLNVRAAAGTSEAFARVRCLVPACAPAEANWKMSNSASQLTIKNAFGITIFGPAGEGVAPPSGVGSREVFKLEANPSAAIVPSSPAYNDGTSSTFGQPNVFSAGSEHQDLSVLRSVVPYTALTRVRINEVFSHSDPGRDWVELHNTTDGTIDVSGWFLSDDFDDLMAFQIPSGSTIPPGGYIVFDENEMGFAFSAACGDEVVLSVGDDTGTLTGERDAVEFGAVENGVSFGLFPDGNGKLLRLRSPTEGTANALPLVGPVVVNEIMYHPPDPAPGMPASPEFVELHNVSQTPVVLSEDFGLDGTYPWRVTGGIALDVPMGTTIPPGGFLVLVPFDPTTDTLQLADFRAIYGLDATVPVVGPYDGGLDNFSDTVRVRRPDTPEPDPNFCGGSGGTGFFVPRVVVDQVTYFDFGAWPTAADGGGPSLERINPLAVGDDAFNWAANPDGEATPGAPNGALDIPTGENPCAAEACVGGECHAVPVPDGTPCSDGDVCNGEERCTDGACLPGLPLICDDGNPCTDDGCEDSACVFVNNASACDDGDTCTTADICTGGRCVGGVTGFTGFTCALDRLTAPDVCSAELPKRLRRVLQKQLTRANRAITKAEAALDRNATRRVRKHLRKARKSLRTLRRKINKTAHAKQAKQRITAACAIQLKGLLELPFGLLGSLRP